MKQSYVSQPYIRLTVSIHDELGWNAKTIAETKVNLPFATSEGIDRFVDRVTGEVGRIALALFSSPEIRATLAASLPDQPDMSTGREP